MSELDDPLSDLSTSRVMTLGFTEFERMHRALAARGALGSEPAVIVYLGATAHVRYHDYRATVVVTADRRLSPIDFSFVSHKPYGNYRKTYRYADFARESVRDYWKVLAVLLGCTVALAVFVPYRTLAAIAELLAVGTSIVAGFLVVSLSGKDVVRHADLLYFKKGLYEQYVLMDRYVGVTIGLALLAFVWTIAWTPPDSWLLPGSPLPLRICVGGGLFVGAAGTFLAYAHALNFGIDKLLSEGSKELADRIIRPSGEPVEPRER